jgi:hypothetical protein
MDQLSSCYFCGGALDVSLSEYPVVPTELRAESEDSKTVVLCTTCRKKLATVVEEVVAATEGDDGGFEPIATEDGPPTAGNDDGGGSDSLLSGDSSSTDRTAGETESAAGTTPRGDASTDDADDGVSLTRLEYNKVMRLLQNREFPVDKSEIREVAVNAYQIRPDEFDTVIDAAVERELIAERDGQFVDPP